MKTPKQIIDQLASKELSFGCMVVSEYNGIKFRQTILAKTAAGNWLVRTGVGETTTTIKIKDIKEILGHQIYIGDVLEWMLQNLKIEQENTEMLLLLWSSCGFTRSLQQIEEGSGYECTGHETGEAPIFCPENNCNEQRLKDPKAQSLYLFLNEIIN